MWASRALDGDGSTDDGVTGGWSNFAGPSGAGALLLLRADPGGGQDLDRLAEGIEAVLEHLLADVHDLGRGQPAPGRLDGAAIGGDQFESAQRGAVKIRVGPAGDAALEGDAPALELGVEVVPVLNKMDLPNADPENAKSEIDMARALEGFRAARGDLLDLSFDTISAAGPHAAIPHYRVDEESNLRIEPNSIYLVDSGGQYLDGTTDVTRTIWVGPGEPTAEMKDRFTREDVEPDERLMRSIEEKIDIPENRKDDFRREIMNYIGALAVEGKQFQYLSLIHISEPTRPY